MRFAVLTAEKIGELTSGQSRFALNLSKGLREAGHKVSLLCADLTNEMEISLKSQGISTFSLHQDTTGPVYRVQMMTRFPRVGRELATLALESPPADWYVILSDNAVSSGPHLSGRNTVYISNGDYSLMFLNPRFYIGGGRAVKRLLSHDMGGLILRNARDASTYTLRLGNSEFTRNFMAYLYSVPFHDYIYPPVDIDVFKPICDESREGYVMAIARNANEPGIKLLDMIAKHVPLVVVGGARVNGAKNLGSVSDDELSQLFAKASVTISSVVAEFFGYAVAESLACGTPVIAYDCCGPSELIKNSLNGWVVKSPSEMIDVVRSATSKRLTPEVSKSARDTAKLFSVQASAKRLVTIVQACEEGRHDRTASRLP